jgi:hypothetical protein
MHIWIKEKKKKKKKNLVFQIHTGVRASTYELEVTHSICIRDG